MNEKKLRIALFLVALGCWLLSIPLTFGDKILGMVISDVCSGILLVISGVLFLTTQRLCSSWIAGFVGVWLQFAPLVFWEPSSLMYINNTLIGVLAIILAFHLAENSAVGISIPQGWSFNPSAWTPRVITVGLALICWFISRYLAVFQLGYIDHMTDPFFKDGTLRVITSQISKDFPVPDAGLGALGYTLEFILGWQGSARRWSEMPWLVIIYGILVIPVSVASITLIILQPVAVGAWCSWCLTIAVCMLTMILLTAPELAAVLQFLHQAKKAGNPFWKVFWKGASALKNGLKNAPSKGKTQAWGITFPWNLVITFILGIWLMFSPAVLNTHQLLAISNYIGGPLVSAFSFIAFAEAFRFIRFINILLGIGLIAVIWITPVINIHNILNNLLVGIVVIALSLPKGEIRERYGAWGKFIR